MALHTLDQKIINNPDVLHNRPGLGTVGISPTIEGQATGKVVTKDAQIIVNDGTNNRVLIGLF